MNRGRTHRIMPRTSRTDAFRLACSAVAKRCAGGRCGSFPAAVRPLPQVMFALMELSSSLRGKGKATPRDGVDSSPTWESAKEKNTAGLQGLKYDSLPSSHVDASTLPRACACSRASTLRTFTRRAHARPHVRSSPRSRVHECAGPHGTRQVPLLAFKFL